MTVFNNGKEAWELYLSSQIDQPSVAYGFYECGKWGEERKFCVIFDSDYCDSVETEDYEVYKAIHIRDYQNDGEDADYRTVYITAYANNVRRMNEMV